MFQNVRRLLRSVLLDVMDLETFLLSGLNGWYGKVHVNCRMQRNWSLSSIFSLKQLTGIFI